MKVLEHYTSVQGEGPHTGVMTQFIRFAGCNMRCPGWPCDTPHAIEPSLYLGKYVNGSAEETFENLRSKVGRNICFTGGEPFMQDHKELIKLCTLLGSYNFTVEFFTNGSFVIPEEILVPKYVSIMMDWKLAGSGEAETHRVERMQNALRLFYSDGIKFVVKSELDLREAVEVSTSLRNQGCKAEFWVGTAWDQISEAELVSWMVLHGINWRLNVQIHKYIWPADKIGV